MRPLFALFILTAPLFAADPPKGALVIVGGGKLPAAVREPEPEAVSVLVLLPPFVPVSSRLPPTQLAVPPESPAVAVCPPVELPEDHWVYEAEYWLPDPPSEFVPLDDELAEPVDVPVATYDPLARLVDVPDDDEVLPADWLCEPAFARE